MPEVQRPTTPQSNRDARRKQAASGRIPTAPPTNGGGSPSEAIRKHLEARAREAARAMQADGAGAIPATRPVPRKPAAHAPGGPQTRGYVESLPVKHDGVLGAICKHVGQYVYMANRTRLMVAAWTLATRHTEMWNCFGHLLAWSRQMRCGKTRLLEVLCPLCPSPKLGETSKAAVYRAIRNRRPRPTFLLDEVEYINRRASEDSIVFSEMLLAGTSRKATKSICVWDRTANDWVDKDMSIYCPKVLALIGIMRGPMRDRCLSVILRRIKRAIRERLERQGLMKTYIMDEADAEAALISEELRDWALKEATQKAVKAAFARRAKIGLNNERLDELLIPLFTVLEVLEEHDCIPLLEEWAREQDDIDEDESSEKPELILLRAMRDILTESTEEHPHGYSFMLSKEVKERLAARLHEQWAAYNNTGSTISERAIADLLEKFDIRPRWNPGRHVGHGYYRKDFEESWAAECADSADPESEDEEVYEDVGGRE
jgi:hypothetical protein